MQATIFTQPDQRLHRPLTKGRGAEQDGAAVILQRAGNNLRCRG